MLNQDAGQYIEVRALQMKNVRRQSWSCRRRALCAPIFGSIISGRPRRMRRIITDPGCPQRRWRSSGYRGNCITRQIHGTPGSLDMLPLRTIRSMHLSWSSRERLSNQWSEIGIYVFTAEQDGHGVQWVGSHIRPRVRIPPRWHWPVGLKKTLRQFGYARPAYSNLLGPGNLCRLLTKPKAVGIGRSTPRWCGTCT